MFIGEHTPSALCNSGAKVMKFLHIVKAVHPY